MLWIHAYSQIVVVVPPFTAVCSGLSRGAVPVSGIVVN
jgi:hypothetical protein